MSCDSHSISLSPLTATLHYYMVERAGGGGAWKSPSVAMLGRTENDEM